MWKGVRLRGSGVVLYRVRCRCVESGAGHGRTLISGRGEGRSVDTPQVECWQTVQQRGEEEGGMCVTAWKAGCRRQRRIHDEVRRKRHRSGVRSLLVLRLSHFMESFAALLVAF